MDNIFFRQDGRPRPPIKHIIIGLRECTLHLKAFVTRKKACESSFNYPGIRWRYGNGKAVTDSGYGTLNRNLLQAGSGGLNNEVSLQKRRIVLNFDDTNQCENLHFTQVRYIVNKKQ